MKTAWLLIIIIGIGNPVYKQADQIQFATFASQTACEDAKSWILANAVDNLASAQAAGITYTANPQVRCFPSFVKDQK
jgi:hypothetical protein